MSITEEVVQRQNGWPCRHKKFGCWIAAHNTLCCNGRLNPQPKKTFPWAKLWSQVRLLYLHPCEIHPHQDRAKFRKLADRNFVNFGNFIWKISEISSKFSLKTFNGIYAQSWPTHTRRSKPTDVSFLLRASPLVGSPHWWLNSFWFNSLPFGTIFETYFNAESPCQKLRIFKFFSFQIFYFELVFREESLLHGPHERNEKIARITQPAVESDDVQGTSKPCSWDQAKLYCCFVFKESHVSTGQYFFVGAVCEWSEGQVRNRFFFEERESKNVVSLMGKKTSLWSRGNGVGKEEEFWGLG